MKKKGKKERAMLPRSAWPVGGSGPVPCARRVEDTHVSFGKARQGKARRVRELYVYVYVRGWHHPLSVRVLCVGLLAFPQNPMSRTRALSGRNTSSSLPGGIFAKPPEYDGQQILAQKQALEGQVNGRFNTSSIAGGIFAAAGQHSTTATQGIFAAGGARLPQTAMGVRPASATVTRTYVNEPSIDGGIFAGAQQPQPSSGGPRDPGPILGGGGQMQSAAADAAGGHSSNARQLQSIHTRGNLRGGGQQPQPPTTADGAFARFLGDHGGNTSAAAPAPSSQPPSARSCDAFLDAVSAAEERDESDLATLAQLRELEEQTELIEAAAAQLAAEQQMGPAEQEALRLAMLERVRHRALALREQMKQQERQQPQLPQQSRPLLSLQQPSMMHSAGGRAMGSGPNGGRPAAGGASGRPLHGLMHAPPPPASRPPPGMGTLEGILSRASPRGEVQPYTQQLPNPLKGRGMCNPALGGGGCSGTQGACVPFGGIDASSAMSDAAGRAGGTDGWRGGGGGVQGGGQHYAQLRLEHHHSPSKQRPVDSSLKYRPESQVSFGGPARILYPGSDVMIRGKYPGY